MKVEHYRRSQHHLTLAERRARLLFRLTIAIILIYLAARLIGLS